MVSLHLCRLDLHPMYYTELVCVCSWLPVPGGSCNYAISIATSSPRESPPHMCYPVVLGGRHKVWQI
jgi:hypothetical protein